jgi:hypothetical protein
VTVTVNLNDNGRLNSRLVYYNRFITCSNITCLKGISTLRSRLAGSCSHPPRFFYPCLSISHILGAPDLIYV